MMAVRLRTELVKPRVHTEMYRDCLYSSDSVQFGDSQISPISQTSTSDVGSSEPPSPLIRQPVFKLSASRPAGATVDLGGSDRTDISGYETDDCLRTCINCEEEKFINEESSQHCYWCTQCEGYVIDSCVVSHMVSKQTRLHSLADDKGHFPQVCWQHKDLIAFYCYDCDINCCTHCVLTHCSHIFKPIGMRRSELGQEVEGLQNLRIAREREMLLQKEEVEMFQNKCETKKRELSEKVRTRFASLREALVQMEHKSLLQIENTDSFFDPINQKFHELHERSTVLRQDLDVTRQAPHPQIDDLIERHNSLYVDETELLVASLNELPQLTDRAGDNIIQHFKDTVSKCTYDINPPSIRREFQALPTKERCSSLMNPTTHPIRDISLDVKSQRIYVTRKSDKTIQQYNIQGDLLADITLHQQPWRVQVYDDVLYYTTEPLDGVFSVPLSQPDPQVKKICGMKCCAFAVMNEQTIVLSRDSKHEIIKYDFNINQVNNRTTHRLNDIHYLTHQQTSGNIAVSNACAAIVVIYTEDLQILLAIDSNTHGVKWPIGLAFHPSEERLLVADSDNHRVLEIDTRGNVTYTVDNLQGAAFVTFLTKNMFIAASFLNHRIKFITHDQD